MVRKRTFAASSDVGGVEAPARLTHTHGLLSHGLAGSVGAAAVALAGGWG